MSKKSRLFLLFFFSLRKWKIWCFTTDIRVPNDLIGFSGFHFDHPHYDVVILIRLTWKPRLSLLPRWRWLCFWTAPSRETHTNYHSCERTRVCPSPPIVRPGFRLCLTKLIYPSYFPICEYVTCSLPSPSFFFFSFTWDSKESHWKQKARYIYRRDRISRWFSPTLQSIVTPDTCVFGEYSFTLLILSFYLLSHIYNFLWNECGFRGIRIKSKWNSCIENETIVI